MDARVDGMVYASIERPPVLGGKVKSYDAKDALNVAGVHQIVRIDAFTPHLDFSRSAASPSLPITLGGVSRPQEAENFLGQRNKRKLQLCRLQERTARDLAQAMQSGAQRWRC